MHCCFVPPGLSAICKATILAFILLAVCAAKTEAGVLNAEQVVRLQEVGAGKELIAHIIESQAIARALVSFNDVVKMKENGVADESIIRIIDAGNPTVKELAKQDEYDRKLLRHIQRQKEIIKLQREGQDVLVDFITQLMNNEHLQEMVREGKISGEDYRRIVKYLKQFAKDEPTYDWNDEGDIDINVSQ
ncbi:MAG: hypothetical protein R6U55_17150 [Desulfovermiculus sp.]